MAVKKYKHHVDYDWINQKIDGQGGSYGCNSIKGLATLFHIGNQNYIQVFSYNVILFFKYLKQIIKQNIK